MVSLQWPRIVSPGGCGQDRFPSMGLEPIRLDTWTIYYKIYAPHRLKLCEQLADSANDHIAEDIWRGRTLFTLAQSESIFCINFIPTNPYEAQMVLVMRLHGGMDAPSYPMFCHNYPTLKFILPVKMPDQVFDLLKKGIPETINQFESHRRSIIEKALTYFSKDPHSQGLALTLKNEDGSQKTYIWLKGIPADHMEDSSQLACLCQPQ